MWFEKSKLPSGFEPRNPLIQGRDARQYVTEELIGLLKPIKEVDGFESYYAGHLSFLLEIR